MVALAVVLTLVTGTLAVPFPPALHRIIGGQDAERGQFPGIVSLRYTNSFVCGGAIISPDLILTAAHCIVGLPAKDIDVIAGSLSAFEGGIRVPAKEAVYHENFGTGNGLQNDIGLVLLQSSLNYTSDIQPLRLADNTTVKPGDTVTAIGWGAMSYPDNEAPDILQYVDGKIRTNEECARELDEEIIDGQVCLGGIDGQGMCFGDSGSPLISNKDITVGIVSYGRPCAVGYPDVFTRVSAYQDWINENAQKMREK